MSIAQEKIANVHINTISVGDTIKHNGRVMTVGRHDIKHDPLIGITVFGDSYHAGNKPVQNVILPRALPNLNKQ